MTDTVPDSSYPPLFKNANILFGKLHSIQKSLDRKSKVSEKSQLLLHKFMQQLEKIFKNYLNVWNGRVFMSMISHWSGKFARIFARFLLKIN